MFSGHVSTFQLLGKTDIRFAKDDKDHPGCYQKSCKSLRLWWHRHASTIGVELVKGQFRQRLIAEYQEAICCHQSNRFLAGGLWSFWQNNERHSWKYTATQPHKDTPELHQCRSMKNILKVPFMLWFNLFSKLQNWDLFNAQVMCKKGFGVSNSRVRTVFYYLKYYQTCICQDLFLISLISDGSFSQNSKGLE